MNAWTRDDIEKAIRSRPIVRHWVLGADSVTVEDAVDAVHALVSGSDPAVYVVRESDIAAVEVRCEGPVLYAGDWVVRTDMYVAEEWRDKADRYRRSLVETEAVIRAIEAEQATDPVEAKARELWNVVHADDGVEWEQAVSHVHERYFRLARHVLGQEADQ